MCTFDAPIVSCDYCREYVLRDQTCEQCAEEHACGDRECPLRDCFELSPPTDGVV